MNKQQIIIILAALVLGGFAFFLFKRDEEMDDAFDVNRVSNNGIKLVTRHEGLKLIKYKDPIGIWTIGYGHKLLPGETYDAITLEKAEQLLEQDLNIAADAVRRMVKVPLNQNQFDALASFVFNVGSGNFQGSTLLRKLNKGDYEGAAQEFKRWVYGTEKDKSVKLPGLIRRRADEEKLFRK